MTLVMLAAGMGSRFGGLKQLAELGPNGETLLAYALHDAARLGFRRVVFVIRQAFAEAFRAQVLPLVPASLEPVLVFQELDALPEGLTAPTDREKPWGTGHAVWVCAPVVDEPFVVLNADDFYGYDALKQLRDFFARLSQPQAPCFAMSAYALGETLSLHGPVNRGICAVEPDGKLRGITEQKGLIATADGQGVEAPDATGQSARKFALDAPVSLNCFGFTPALFPLLEAELRGFFAQPPEALAQAECYLPAVVTRAIQAGVATVQVCPTSARWFGLTYPDDRPAVEARLRELVQSGAYPSPLR